MVHMYMNNNEFVFDAVFNESATNDLVYLNTAAPLGLSTSRSLLSFPLSFPIHSPSFPPLNVCFKALLSSLFLTLLFFLCSFVFLYFPSLFLPLLILFYTPNFISTSSTTATTATTTTASSSSSFYSSTLHFLLFFCLLILPLTTMLSILLHCPPVN